MGTANSFTVGTTGFPAPSLTKTAGTLPSGVAFTDNGNGTATLSGIPTTGGVSTLTFTGTNSSGTTSQNFALTVNQTPFFVNANKLTVQLDTAGSLVIMTQGFPVPSITETGALPAGMSFTDNGDSTGTLAGTPTQAGVFPIHFAGTNSTGTATQNFTLTVTVTQQAAATTTTFRSSLSPSSVDQTVTFTATVSSMTAGIPAGSDYLRYARTRPIRSSASSAAGIELFSSLNMWRRM